MKNPKAMTVADPPDFLICDECGMHCHLSVPPVGHTEEIFTKRDALMAIDSVLKRRLISEEDALRLERQIKETNLPFNVPDLAVEGCVTYYKKYFDDETLKIMAKFSPANRHCQNATSH